MTQSLTIQPDRLAGLRRFAIAISFLTILGHSFLGFEASYAYPLVSLATGYSVELLLELVDAKVNHYSRSASAQESSKTKQTVSVWQRSESKGAVRPKLQFTRAIGGCHN